MEYDAHNGCFIVNAFDIQVISGDATNVGNIIDTIDFEAIEFCIQAGALTTGTYTVILEDGDAANLSDAAVIDSELVLGALPVFADTDDDAVKRVGTVTKKRYVRLSILSADTAAGTMGATATKSVADSSPTDAQA